MGWQDAPVESGGWQNAPVEGDGTQDWGTVGSRSVNAIPSSAKNAAQGFYQMLRHPLDTAGNLIDVAAGGLKNAMPTSVQKFVDSIDPNAEAGNAAQAKANQVGQMYSNRYGTMEGFKEGLATDPVGMAMDLSTLLTGGASAVGKVGALTSKLPAVAGPLAKVAGALDTAATYTNPVNLVGPASNAATYIPKQIAKQVVGSPLASGVGAENISTAFNAGKNGQSSFWDNMTGKVPTTDVLDTARQALENMRTQRKTDYVSGIQSTAANTTKVPFQPISDALDNVIDSMMSPNGKWKIGEAEQAHLAKLEDIVNQWKNSPNSHTALELDALKQRIDALYPESPAYNQAQRANTTVRNAVKDTIVKQVPEYADTMAAYEQALALEKEIQAAVLGKDKASANTALRKLQALGARNADMSGTKIQMLHALEDKGGVNLMPAISGQMFNSWLPRSNLGHLGEGAAVIGAFSHPGSLLALPFMSPKIVGAGLYGAGKTAGGLKSLSNYLGDTAPVALGATQAGNLDRSLVSP